MKLSTILEDQGIATFTVFNFSHHKGWAFAQMGIAPRKLTTVSGLVFSKMMGCGRGLAFSLKPDFSRYTFFAVWKSEEDAKNFFNNNPTIKAYITRSLSVTYFLSPIQSRGTWDGQRIFKENKEKSEQKHLHSNKAIKTNAVNGLPTDIKTERTLTETKKNAHAETLDREVESYPIAVLTRATLRPQSLLSFWKNAFASTESLKNASGLIFSIGAGEIPFLRQATFSIWENEEAVKAYAYQQAEHLKVIRLRKEKSWYSEELFARFYVLNKREF